ncbi:hypothetical protein HMI55_006006, partial [Coelomomyces lativittatus]
VMMINYILSTKETKYSEQFSERLTVQVDVRAVQGSSSRCDRLDLRRKTIFVSRNTGVRC